MSEQQLTEQCFATSVAIPPLHLVALTMHMLLFLVVPDTSRFPLLLERKCTFKALNTREKIIKFVGYSVCDCFTQSFVSFVMARMHQ